LIRRALTSLGFVKRPALEDFPRHESIMLNGRFFWPVDLSDSIRFYEFLRVVSGQGPID